MTLCVQRRFTHQNVIITQSCAPILLWVYWIHYCTSVSLLWMIVWAIYHLTNLCDHGSKASCSIRMVVFQSCRLLLLKMFATALETVAFVIGAKPRACQSTRNLAFIDDLLTLLNLLCCVPSIQCARNHAAMMYMHVHASNLVPPTHNEGINESLVLVISHKWKEHITMGVYIYTHR